MTFFKYLGRMISEADNDWPEVVKNLSRARKVWSRMSLILSREVAAPRVSGFLFKSVVQVVLLFGEETGVVTPRMVKSLGGGSDPGGETDDGTSPAEDTGQEVEIHLGGGGKGEGGIIDDGGL